jgi:hypothetical protein
MSIILGTVILFLIPFILAAGEAPLVVPAGVPLRLYLTKRVSKRVGAPVEAKLLEPVYAFDKEVIPAGTVVLGHIVRLQGISEGQRAMTILGGDFTPLHTAPVEFTTVVMPDGRNLPLHTVETVGLSSVVPSRPPKNQSTPAPQSTGMVGAGKQQVKDAIQGQIDRAKSIPDIVRGPDKKEIAEDYLMAKLPYHPQYVRKGTRFDAELVDPLTFGSEPVTPDSLALLGTQPPADSVGRARLITPIDSATSQPGAQVEAVLAEPVFSADHKLVLPEGTHVKGIVVLAKRARWFHRGGQLRFKFQEIELPAEVARLRENAPLLAEQPAQEKLNVRTEASLQSAESTGKASLKVDGEGGVQAKESKTRFLGAAVSVLLAKQAGDNDAIRNGSGQIVGQSQNVAGRTIGGGFGFGLLGTGIAQSSRWVGAAFGYYGMAWSLYSTIIARGQEVAFGRNAMVEIRFDTRRTPDAAQKPASAIKQAVGK